MNMVHERHKQCLFVGYIPDWVWHFVATPIDTMQKFMQAMHCKLINNVAKGCYQFSSQFYSWLTLNLRYNF